MPKNKLTPEEVSKRKWTDEERQELAKKLDDDLDDFINNLEPKPYTDGWTKETLLEDLETHPLFMTESPKPGDKLHPLTEGLMQLKYDPLENTPEELAISYKEDGDFNFKYKNYRLAIVAYSEAIKAKSGNVEVESKVYNNRSAAHWFLGNYRSCLRDCELALKLNPDYVKAIVRATNCCFKLNRYDKCMEYCDDLIKKNVEDKEKYQEMRGECVKRKKAAERDERKREAELRRKRKEDENILAEIKKRNISIDTGKDPLSLKHLEAHFPNSVHARVHIDDGVLIWPVIFMYPEHNTTDFIQNFAEDDVFYQHLAEMFSEPPEWDAERKYKLGELNVYYENQKTLTVHKVDVNASLRTILQDEAFVVRGGTPCFIVYCKDSKAEEIFLSKYHNREVF